MTGKAYYLTTLGDWQRHTARFANSHFIVLRDDSPGKSATGDAGTRLTSVTNAAVINGASVGARLKPAPTDETPATPGNEMKILVLIEADEGVHLSLEDEPAFEPLPHPLAQKPLSAAAQAALAPHGVAPGATTFEAAETIASVHPLLRHRVF